jgi:hypothetical protein
MLAALGMEWAMARGWILTMVVVLGCNGDDAGSGSMGGSGGGTDEGGVDDLDYCPGLPMSPEPVCRTNADCASGEMQCGPAGAVSQCGGAGGCVEPWTEGTPCQSDDDCMDDGVCRTGEDPCCGEVSACVPRCTPESCAAGERCEADGLCAPIRCDDGFACAEGSRCEPNGGDAHGCVVIPCDEAGALACPLLHECVASVCQRSTCEADDDCSCGNCLDSQCWETPWYCYSEPA